MHRGFSSITTRWVITIALIISTVVVLILLANSIFLDDFYMVKNRSLFYKEFEYISDGFVSPDNDLLDLLREEDRKTGFLFYIAEIQDDSIGEIIVASQRDSIGRILPEPPVKAGFPGGGLPLPQLDFVISNSETLFTGEPVYGRVQRELRDLNEFDLVFASRLNENYLLVITRPVEQLDEHSAVTNQFLLLIAVFVLLISIIIARISAKSIVKPIKEITEIAEHIADLDFSHRYTGNARDETGILGDSINRISAQLDTSIKDLERTNEKLKVEMDLQRRFFAGVSHEFKTPVGLIRGYSESLQLGLAKDLKEVKEFSTIILEETDRLNHLITDILFLVKSESTEFTLHTNEIDLIPLIDSIIEKNIPAAITKQIRLARSLPESAIVTADEVRVGQIIDNLMSNAFRHTPTGGEIAIRVSVESGEVTVCIINEGDHIDEKDIAHLFDPFYSAFESRDKQSSGTGLGLSIVKSLVDRHGGHCGIENVNDEKIRGVRAWFSIPVSKLS